MKILNNLVIFFYTFVFLVIGAFMITLSLRIISMADISAVIEYGYTSQNMRLITGGIGLLLIIISISVAQLTVGGIQRERTIAFDNPDGQVSISLSAIEDYIKRFTQHVPEVKEFKPTVTAGKRGIEILNKVILWSDANIPEATERLQSMIKSRIQAMLGIEESMKVLIHVGKIAQRGEKQKVEEKEPEPKIPFRGYGEE